MECVRIRDPAAITVVSLSVLRQCGSHKTAISGQRVGMDTAPLSVVSMQGVQAPAIKVTLPVALDSRDSKRRRWGWGRRGGGSSCLGAGGGGQVDSCLCNGHCVSLSPGSDGGCVSRRPRCCCSHRVVVKLESVPIVTADRSVNGESGSSLCCESSSADFSRSAYLADFSQTVHIARGVDFSQTAYLARGADFSQTAHLRVLPWRRCCWGDVPTAFFTFRVTTAWRQSYECVLFLHSGSV